MKPRQVITGSIKHMPKIKEEVRKKVNTLLLEWHPIQHKNPPLNLKTK